MSTHSKTYESSSEEETAAIACHIADIIRTEAQDNNQNTALYCLQGPLGAGKSVIARNIIRRLCNDETLDVPSPTFTLYQIYDSPSGQLYHFDLYRLKSEEEIYELGFDEALASGIVFLEWPERVSSFLPSHYTAINITVPDSHKRVITIEKHAS